MLMHQGVGASSQSVIWGNGKDKTPIEVAHVRTVAKRAFIFMYLGLNKKAFILHHTFVLRVRILVSPERIEWHVCSYIFGLIG